MPVSTDDHVAVADHIARYCWKVDSGDGDGWADLWTADGVFIGISPEPITGREALRQVPLGVAENFGDTMCHMAGNIFCDYGESRDTIHAHLYNFVTTWGGGDGGKLFTMARCRMTLVRAGAGWLIARNEAVLLGAG